ncbi:hypothetical protein ACFVMC_30515 [Nocardia sp. NPDC127579]
MTGPDRIVVAPRCPIRTWSEPTDVAHQGMSAKSVVPLVVRGW